MLYAVAVLALSLIFTNLFRRRFRSSPPPPPGPTRYPIIGNLSSAPEDQPDWIKYHRLCVEYGSDIIQVERFGVSTIVLDSLEAVNELLVNRSAIYSSRPWSTMFHEIMGLHWLFAFAPNDAFWRERRQLFRKGLSYAETHQPHEIKYVRDFLQRLLNDPENFLQHTRHMAGAIIMAIGYGIDVKPQDDPYILVAERAAEGMAVTGLPGKFLVDYLPFLRHWPKWLPGGNFRRLGDEWAKNFQEMLDRPFQVTKQSMSQGTPQLSFTSRALDDILREGGKVQGEKLVKETAGNIYVAGTDTTVSAISTFFLAMILFPNIQGRAREELDVVLNGNRLPDFADKPLLPYITAIANEVLRWGPVTPLALAHLLEKDDEYKGYRLKKNSTVIANAWSILHNEKDYPDPFAFNPDRFLKNGKLDPSIRSPTAAFGFGPRICPGQHIAYSMLWITIASVLSTVTISEATDNDGHVCKPSGVYEPGLISHPSAFKCSIRPRSSEAGDLIKMAVAGF